MHTGIATVVSLVAGSIVSVAAADVVIQPTAVPSLSTWRACVPPENTFNGSGLSNAAIVANGSAIPAAWPTHVTSGCSNMWHSSCIGQANGTSCEGGDLTPFIVYDLGGLYDLTGFHLWNHNQMPGGTGNETDRGLRNVQVQVSSDGTNYSSPVSFTNMTRASGLTTYTGDNYALPAPSVRYVKFTVLNNWGSTAATGISEIRFIGNPQFNLSSAAASPATIELCAAQPVLLTSRLLGAGSSTGIVVTADATTIGGSVVAMHDDGADGDAVAGDGTYSASVTVPAGFAVGTYTVVCSASDSQGHSGSSSATVTINACVPTFTESGDAGDMPATAAVASGSGPLGRIRGNADASDVDMYKITICDAAAFSASLVGGTTLDTQLFLFDEQGMGVEHNDDTPTGLPGAGALQSTLTGAPSTGNYYLAVSLYNRDPLDASGQLIWANTPFNTQRTPDGPGAANPLASWTNTTTGTGAYAITLAGTCFVSSTPTCPADIGSQGGVAGADGQLDNNDFIVFIDYFFNANPIADIGVQGGVPGSDGQFDNNDFIVFIDRFFTGCN